MIIKHADDLLHLPLDRERRVIVRQIYRRAIRLHRERSPLPPPVTARAEAERLAFYMVVRSHPGTLATPRNAAAVEVERSTLIAYLDGLRDRRAS